MGKPWTASLGEADLLESRLCSLVSVVTVCSDEKNFILPNFPSCPADIPPSRDKFLPRPEVTDVWVGEYVDLAGTYNKVKECGVPNYRGARIPLSHGINIREWRKAAHLLRDKSLPDMLAYGFPSRHMGKTVPAVGLANHSSASRNPGHIKKFLEKETTLGALAGPFRASPFAPWCRGNPLMTRPKRGSDELRVILDLSFPEGSGVNSGIVRDSLDGAPFKLKLPSPLDLGKLMLSLGKGCKLYKVDLSRAYQQLRSDPLDWPLLGISWDGGYYVDLAIPFGLHHGASACQRVSEAAGQIASERYGSTPLAYVDDTGGGALENEADAHYKGLLTTLSKLGLVVALAKCQAPSYVMLWVGVLFNTLTLSMAIDPERVKEAVAVCREFLGLSTVTLHKLQQVLGKLFHAVKCTVSARMFMSRLLDLLRSATRQQVVMVTDEARADARWLIMFLERFNGVTLAKPDVAEYTAFVDSCLKGAGGVCQGFGYYSTEYPDYLRECCLSISSLECFNLLVAVRVWVRQWAGHHILIFCDNAATVAAMNSGRAQDPLIRAALRECWWLTAIWDVQLTVRHRPGAQMEEADLLSRAATSEAFREKFRQYELSSPQERKHIGQQHLSPPISI